MISSRTRFLYEKLRDRFLFKKKGSILVVCWNMSHNPLGRAFLFADFLRRDYKTKIVGPTFTKFSKRIWFPLRKYLKGADTFPAANFPEFLDQATEFAKRQPKVDIVVICKPRLPSILIGLLVAQKNNARVILDIDDYELAFFENQKPLELQEAIQKGLDLSNPYHETWTRVCHSMVDKFPNRIVSNHMLQEKFGGIIIPHVRNERIFNPKLYNRKKIRKKYGYSETDKVILFLGTPREHKGFERIPKALKEIGNPTYKFCLIGKIRNDVLRERFHQEYGDFVQSFSDSDFRDLPEKLMLADLICLLQDEDSLVSEYQLPAKLMDALAMGVPVLARPVGPLVQFAAEGLLIPHTGKSLREAIEEIFTNLESQKKVAFETRNHYFRDGYSYKAASSLMRSSQLAPMSAEVINEILSKIENESKGLLRN